MSRTKWLEGTPQLDQLSTNCRNEIRTKTTALLSLMHQKVTSALSAGGFQLFLSSVSVFFPPVALCKCSLLVLSCYPSISVSK